MEQSSLSAYLVVLQKMKSQQPLAPQGDLAGPTQMVEQQPMVLMCRLN